MIGSELLKLKTAFYESHFCHCALASLSYEMQKDLPGPLAPHQRVQNIPSIQVL